LRELEEDRTGSGSCWALVTAVLNFETSYQPPQNSLNLHVM